MNFRNFVDLERSVVKYLPEIPGDVDLIAGIPRSGLLPGLQLALHLNLPITDIEGLLNDNIFQGGERLKVANRITRISEARKILVIDDSLSTGNQIDKTKALLKDTDYFDKLLFAAVYVTEHNVNKVDFAFEICNNPRVFSWNMMHHQFLEIACVDIDGVLCADPTVDENDDGEKYKHFLLNAKPLFLPTRKIGALVTSRLEKYREQTEQWLQYHNVVYDELIMLDLPSARERSKSGLHGKHKADVFKSCHWARLFIESSRWQAKIIAEQARKPVICTDVQELFLPGWKSVTQGAIKKTNKEIVDRIYRKLLAINR